MKIEIKNIKINFSVSEMTQEFYLQNDVSENIFVIFDDDEIIFRNVVFFINKVKYKVLEIKTLYGYIVDWSEAYDKDDNYIIIDDIEIVGLYDLYSSLIEEYNEEKEIEEQNKSEFIEHLKLYSK